MKDYWLAKLISCVPAVNSRKRLQKSIYLLQVAGCPLQCDYLLHYYGPYSFELAALMDQLDGADIIEETPEQLGTGVVRYASRITDKGTDVLSSFERTERGREVCGDITPFIPEFQKLNAEDAWVLELAATVGYYHEDDWQNAQVQTAKFKRIHENDTKLLTAIKLAKEFVNTR